MSEFIDRTKVDYVDKNERFLIKSRTYKRQYANIYSTRLSLSRQNLEEAARKKLGEEVAIKRLSELVEGERCVVVGTLFKQMVHKPNILREISEEQQLEPQPVKLKFTDASDVVILEDELQRIVLQGGIVADECVTGVTVAVVGKQDGDSGKFEVEEVIYRSMEEREKTKTEGEDVYMLIVSGMEIGGKEDERHLFELQLLVDVVNGALEDGRGKMGKVVRVVVAGNSFGASVVERDGVSHGRQKKKKMSEEDMLVKSALQHFDDLLFQLAINTQVDILPGPNDPTNYALPQKPFHPCLFPHSSTLSSVHFSPNPYHASIDGCEVLGTAGQPTNDIISISNICDPIHALQQTLTFTHLAPSSPDTMPCYPYDHHDPFFITQPPDVYFTGNSKKFAFKHHTSEHGHKTLLVAVPVFKSSKTAVLINLKTLSCEAVRVSV